MPHLFAKGELDEETGLYYYGARYLDPKYSRWLSADPAMGEYIPQAGTDTSKLPGLGGVYNSFNFAVFGYANNNPIRYNDPTGEIPTDYEAALIADHVYNGNIGDILEGGWTLEHIERLNEKGGTGAIGVYSRYNFDANGNATVEYVLANRGTTFDNVYDWEQNFDQFIGQSSDFWSSVVYASDFVRMHHNQEVTMVGHSNGGAEAIGNALATNTSAIIFNPAKLNSSYYDGKINNYNKTINAFIVDGDILNAIFGDPQSGINKTKLPAQYEKAYRYSHSRGYELSIINECFHILWKQLLKLWSRINMKNRTWFLIFIICFIFILFALNTEEFVFIVSWTIIAIFGNIINFFKNIF